MSHTCRSLLAVALIGCGGGGGNTGDDDTTVDAPTTTMIDAPIQVVTWPALAAIPLTSPDGSFWGPMFTFGDQAFMMDLDTGSTTSAVAGKGCTTCASVGITQLWMPDAAAVNTHNLASTTYEDGSGWSGTVYTDATNLAGTPNVPLDFASIATQQDFFYDDTYQGILGLGAPENAEMNTGSYFYNAKDSGLVPIMAFELCPTTGTMWLGGFDPTHASAAPGYTPLVPITADQPFYAVDITSLSIGATNIGTGAATFTEMGYQPVVDTGTSLFTVPTTMVTKILTAINGDAGFKSLFGATAKLTTVESSSGGCITKAGVTQAMVDAMMPTLSIAFPNKAGGADISYTAKPTLSYMYDGGGGQWCFGIDTTGGDGVTMGDQIMQAFVTIIDLQNQQVGWAPDSGCSSNTFQHRRIERATFHPHPPKPRPHHHH